MGFAMTWVPIIYFCLSNGACGFLQGNPTYTEGGCKEQLDQASVYMNQDPEIAGFDATCVRVASI